jgi:hypothetical protein
VDGILQHSVALPALLWQRKWKPLAQQRVEAFSYYFSPLLHLVSFCSSGIAVLACFKKACLPLRDHLSVI